MIALCEFFPFGNDNSNIQRGKCTFGLCTMHSVYLFVRSFVSFYHQSRSTPTSFGLNACLIPLPRTSFALCDTDLLWISFSRFVVSHMKCHHVVGVACHHYHYHSHRVVVVGAVLSLPCTFCIHTHQLWRAKSVQQASIPPYQINEIEINLNNANAHSVHSLCV